MRAVRYIFRESARELDGDGIVSNIAQDPDEIASVLAALEELELKGGRKNANVYMSVIHSLPHELIGERKALVREICRTFEELGLPYAAALHCPDPNGDQRNFHVHILFSWRPFERTEKGYAFSDLTLGAGNDPEFVTAFRKRSAQLMNQAMERAGHTRRFTAEKTARPNIQATDDKRTPGQSASKTRSENIEAMKSERGLLVTLGVLLERARSLTTGILILDRSSREQKLATLEHYETELAEQQRCLEAEAVAEASRTADETVPHAKADQRSRVAQPAQTAPASEHTADVPARATSDSVTDPMISHEKFSVQPVTTATKTASGDVAASRALIDDHTSVSELAAPVEAASGTALTATSNARGLKDEPQTPGPTPPHQSSTVPVKGGAVPPNPVDTEPQAANRATTVTPPLAEVQATPGARGTAPTPPAPASTNSRIQARPIDRATKPPLKSTTKEKTNVQRRFRIGQNHYDRFSRPAFGSRESGPEFAAVLQSTGSIASLLHMSRIPVVQDRQGPHLLLFRTEDDVLGRDRVSRDAVRWPGDGDRSRLAGRTGLIGEDAPLPSGLPLPSGGGIPVTDPLPDLDGTSAQANSATAGLVLPSTDEIANAVVPLGSEPVQSTAVAAAGANERRQTEASRVASVMPGKTVVTSGVSPDKQQDWDALVKSIAKTQALITRAEPGAIGPKYDVPSLSIGERAMLHSDRFRSATEAKLDIFFENQARRHLMLAEVKHRQGLKVVRTETASTPGSHSHTPQDQEIVSARQASDVVQSAVENGSQQTSAAKHLHEGAGPAPDRSIASIERDAAVDKAATTQPADKSSSVSAKFEPTGTEIGSPGSTTIGDRPEQEQSIVESGGVASASAAREAAISRQVQRPAVVVNEKPHRKPANAPTKAEVDQLLKALDKIAILPLRQLPAVGEGLMRVASFQLVVEEANPDDRDVIRQAARLQRDERFQAALRKAWEPC